MDEVTRLTNELTNLRQRVEETEARLKAAQHDALPNWEVVWYQSLLLYAGVPVECEVLEDGLTRAQAEARRAHYVIDFAGAIGVVVIARPTPPQQVREMSSKQVKEIFTCNEND